MLSNIKFINSPVTSFNYLKHQFFIKRDELLNPLINGNKARKLYSLVSNPWESAQKIISYGGAQSNLMYALANLAKLRNWQFDYYTKFLPVEITAPSNLSASLALGMQIHPLGANYLERIKNLATKLPTNTLLIPQGGACFLAESGLIQLANELKSWAQEHAINQLSVFIASGTGASAYYLQKHLTNFKVYTTNCVGSKEYLIQQMQALEPEITNPLLPTILENTKYRFAKPNWELYSTLKEIEKVSLCEFDLIYDSVAWQIILDNLMIFQTPIMYIHCGGLLGNSSQFKRYQTLKK